LSGGDSSGGVEAPGLVAQFAVRTATVDYGGAILQALGEGQSRLSPAYVPESLLLAVPSFLWPAKLDRGSALLPNQLQMDAFGLQKTNFISGTAGQYFGFLSPAWLVMLFGLLGIIFGRFERWLLRERTPPRMVLLAGAVLAAFGSPAGVPTMLLQMRSAGVIALIACAVAFLRLPDRATPLDSATAAAPARPSAFARL
jgi:hypothetical protein